jgi:hypothetical protein
MSLTTGTAASLAAAIGGARGPLKLSELVATVTLAGTYTMTAQYRNIQKLNTSGANRNVLLPPEEDGMFYWFVNAATAAENLVVKDDSGVTTVVTINQNEEAIVYCAGTTWVLLRVATIALS